MPVQEQPVAQALRREAHGDVDILRGEAVDAERSDDAQGHREQSLVTIVLAHLAGQHPTLVLHLGHLAHAT